MQVRRGELAGVYQGVDPVDDDLGAAEAKHSRCGGGEASEGEGLPEHGCCGSWFLSSCRVGFGDVALGENEEEEERYQRVPRRRTEVELYGSMPAVRPGKELFKDWKRQVVGFETIETI